MELTNGNAIVINEDNMQISEVQEFSLKVRAILVDKHNRILTANYGGVYLLPGGSVDCGETIVQAVIRELSEETGEKYNEQELEYLTCLKYYQKNYPKRDGTFQNRLVQTHYFVGKLKEVSKSSQTLTDKEKKGNFRLEFFHLEELEKAIYENTSDNPRNVYFGKEILSVIQVYKDKSNQNI